MQRLGETEIARDRIMRKTELTKEVCPFCGKRKIVTITTKDFWEEHRGNSWTEEEREEEDCGCTFSRMLKDKAELFLAVKIVYLTVQASARTRKCLILFFGCLSPQPR